MASSRSLLLLLLLSTLQVWGCAEDKPGSAGATGSAVDAAVEVDLQETEDVDGVDSIQDVGEIDALAVDVVGQDLGVEDAGSGCASDCAALPLPKGGCLEAVCNHLTGACELHPLPLGTACDDGKVCTADACNDSGQCLGTLDCPAEEICVEAYCAADGSCATKTRAGPCDDGNLCTVDDHCAFKACNGTPIDSSKACDDADACTQEGCAPAKGCVHEAVAAGQPCEDGDVCTVSDTCDAKGSCESGGPLDCDDGDGCTQDTCTGGKGGQAGCQHGVEKDGIVCDDGSLCTEGDACLKGLCVGELIDAAKPSSVCTQLLCDPKTAAVTVVHGPDGVPCSDGEVCTVGDACLKGVCVGAPLKCDQGNACQDDSCDPVTGSCVSKPKPKGEKCDDGDACTTQDACLGGQCVGAGYAQTGQCDDNQACTVDACAPQLGCYHLPIAGKLCDDGDLCTIQDACDKGSCVGAPKDCGDGNPCTMDGCAQGACTHQVFLGPCDDGDACTTGEFCKGGECVGAALDCDDDNPCTKDGCASKGGCTHLPLPGGTTCSDGLSCTVGDKCDGGKCKGLDKCVSCDSDLHCLPYDEGDLCAGKLRCVQSFKGKVCALEPGKAVVCPPTGSPCAVNACDPKTGSCVVSFKQAGVPCVTGDKCQQAEICDAKGGCAGAKVGCDDGEPCTVDGCDSTLGCVHTPRLDGASCALGTPKCWLGASCAKGKCQGENACSCTSDADCASLNNNNLCDGIVGCVAANKNEAGVCELLPNSVVLCPKLQGQPCVANVCQAATGKCLPTPVSDGGSCDDGDACTVMEACAGGKCKGVVLKCDGGAPCTFYVCDKVFGCGQGPKPDGAKCDDGNPCSVKDHCDGGVCVGVDGDCDDGNVCTIDLCDKVKGGCASLVEDGGKCDDGDPCTSSDACLDGSCQAKKLGCDDGNSCTIDSCVGEAGCVHLLVPGKDCDDGDPCTTSDGCLAGGVCAGTPRSCEDGNDCTVESCVGGVCVIKALSGKPCDDANACSEGDACDGKGSCVSKPVNCDDGNPCTVVVGLCSPKNGCTVVPSDGKSCNDGDLCTIADKCSGGACQGIALLCDDSDVCTLDSCDPKMGCVNKANTCDDSNDCTLDKCDPPKPWGQGKGCIHQIVDGFQICDDGDACTFKGVCQGAKCETTALKCGDGDPCTLDGCDKIKGCVHLPVQDTSTVCDDGDACTQDHCDGQGSCVGIKLVCDDDNPCTQDLCEPNKGCVTVDLKEGSGCDDGCACTKGTKCQGGLCSGGQVVCKSCPTGADSECAIYDDDDKCNGSFVCTTTGPCAGVVGKGAGVCEWMEAAIVCDPSGDLPCVKNRCDPKTGACKPKALFDGAACDDEQPCSVGDVCQGGVCQAGPPANCVEAADACNDALCVADPGLPKGYRCVSLPRSGTLVSCDADGDGCTAGDHCEQGQCVAGQAIDCGGLKGPCQLAACVPTASGGFTCKLSAMPDKTPCEDGQLCTTGDACVAGQCLAGEGIKSCASLNGPCASWSCDAKAGGGVGACVPTPKNQGGSCDADGNGCTVQDHCDKGVCQPGSLPDCSGKTGPCTLGAWKCVGAVYVCVATPRHELLPCEADGDGCTINDHCEAGVCKSGELKDCSAFSGSGGCVIGTCVSLSASQSYCKGVSASAGTPCDADGSGCTFGDVCDQNGACMAGKAIDCLAFAGACAVGKCVPSKDSPTDFSCVGVPKANGSACDADGDGCTVGDTCQGGKCVPGEPADCSAKGSGACLIGACKNKGSDGYLCLPKPRKDGVGCDADGDGCTVGDVCLGGACVKGALQTCADFASLCAGSTCKSGGSEKFSCVVEAKESWPPLSPPLACTPTDKPPSCPVHYLCTPQGNDPKGEGAVGYCLPKATVYCDDGSACTGQDVCVKGVCEPGVPKNCDDDNPCSLDLCAKGKCLHTPLLGCSLCIDEGFDAKPPAGQLPVLSQSWAVDAQRPEWLSFGLDSSQTWAGSPYALRVKWQGPAPGLNKGVVRARLRHARLYMRPDAPPPVLEFRLSMKVGDQGCDKDVLQVAVNDQLVWQGCDDTAFDKKVGGFEKVVVDLSPWRGAALDISFTALGGADKQGSGLIDIDRVRLSGACSPGCLGVDFETHDPDGLLPFSPPRLPAAMRLDATTPAYLSWAPVVGAGHTGQGAIRAAWSGAPPGSKAQEASLSMPQLRVSAGARLHFALRATGFGISGCAADAVEVKVGAKVVAQLCGDAPVWKVYDIDLSPWVGQAVGLSFRARSGAGVASAGAVFVDDIAVSGACSYTCFEADFDGDLGRWAAAQEGGGAMKWAQVSDKVHSAPKSVFVGHGAEAKAGQEAQLRARADKGAAFMVPVRGAEFRYAVNLRMLSGPEGKTNLCQAPGDGPKSPLRIMLSRLAPGPKASQGAQAGFGLEFPTTELCKATSGWQIFKGKLSAKSPDPLKNLPLLDPRGVMVVPSMVALAIQDGGLLQAWVDDLVFTCH